MPVLASSGYGTAGMVLADVRALLDDNSYGLSILIAAAPTGAVENGGGTIATITSAVPHGLATGASVTLAGIGNALFNGTGAITVLSATQFTIPNTSAAPNATSGGGTITPNISAGDIFTDPVLIPFLNIAYEQLQYELANHGVETFIKDNVVLTLTAIAGADPSIQVTVSDTGYFDGALNHNPPQLPTDLLVPLRIWERTTASSEQFFPMTQRKDGLPSENQQTRLRFWEWRTAGIVMLGALQSNDIRIRYEAVLPDVVQASDAIQIRAATGTLSFYTAALACGSRGSPAKADFEAQGEGSLHRMIVRGVRREQHTMHRRRPYRSHRGNRDNFI